MRQNSVNNTVADHAPRKGSFRKVLMTQGTNDETIAYGFATEILRFAELKYS